MRGGSDCTQVYMAAAIEPAYASQAILMHVMYRGWVARRGDLLVQAGWSNTHVHMLSMTEMYHLCVLHLTRASSSSK